MYYLFDMIENAMEYIAENCNENLNCNLVAEKYAYSEYHFHRLFKNITTVSVTDYIRDRRLFSAANKLLDTNDTILDICLSCGFDNQRTFNRAFKQKYGMSPKDFRIRKEYVDEPAPDKIISNFYYRLQEGGKIMLKPYIVERGVMRLVGRCLKEGGVKQNWEDFDLWGHMDKMADKIPNLVDDKYHYAVSINFANAGDGSRRDYWLCKEVSSYFNKNGIFSKNSEGNWGGWDNLGADLETLTLPATRWLYIPIRLDDPFLRNLALLGKGTFDEVMAEHSMDVSIRTVHNLNKGIVEKEYITNPDAELGPGDLIPPVYLWGLLWLKENGYERQDYPFELEIYGLTDGYDKNNGGPGADMTLAIPMV